MPNIVMSVLNMARRYRTTMIFIGVTILTFVIGYGIHQLIPPLLYVLLVLCVLVNALVWGWMDLREKLRPRLPPYDEEAMQNALALRSLVQGSLVGGLLKEHTRIDQGTDDQGIYLPYFMVYLPSGTVLRVDVTVAEMPR